MGKSIKPKYQLILPNVLAMSWPVKQYGAPNEKNLAEFVFAYAKSLEHGGANEHISVALGYVPYPAWAKIKHNYLGGPVVAEWKAAMFQVYS